MANPIILASDFRVKFKDVFDMKNFYKMIHDWLIEYDWEDQKGDKDHFETYYLEKIGAKGEKEHVIWWRLEKIPSKNSYYKYILELLYHTVALKNTEIVVEGKKLKVNKGEIETKIRTYVELDYEGKWSHHPVLNMFKDIFRERIFKADLESHKRELYRESFILQGAMKKYLKLKGFLPEYRLEPFRPAEAYPTHK
jgi:hypothetical protein